MAPRVAGVDPIARRLRERRGALGLSLAQVSARAGIKAPSFLHHIERGERLPSEEVVTWLAAALQEDEELLRAWVRLRRGAPLDLAIQAAHLLERHLAAEANAEGANHSNGDGTGAVSAAEIRAAASTQEPVPALLMRVPRLEWGAEPGTSSAPADVLRFDPQSLPQEAWLRPFAYRLPEGIPQPAPLQAGDLVLLTRNAWPLHHKAVYLVRASDGLRLRRVAWRNGTLWLAAERLGQAQPLKPSGTPPRDLLGRVAAVIRAGAPAQEA
jgi:transcriptional regulator with XRE-family HTH domain